MDKKCNFSVKPTKKDKTKPVDVQNQILIKRFMRKYKMERIAQELRDRQAPVTRGMKKRKKKHQGKMRHLKKNK